MSDAFLNFGFPAFASHFISALAFLFVFIAIYIRITPYKEITLIREGNTAAAASLSGAVVGYAIALSSSVAHSIDLYDMLIWSAIGLGVQLLAYFITRLMLPDLVKDVPENRLASGLFLGALSISMGLLNAACQTY